MERSSNIFIFQRILKGIESLQQTLISNPYTFATQCRRTETFQTISSVRSNNTPSGCKGIGIGKFEFVAKTQFLCNWFICRDVFRNILVVTINYELQNPLLNSKKEHWRQSFHSFMVTTWYQTLNSPPPLSPMIFL